MRVPGELRERLVALLPRRADWAQMRRSPGRDLLAGLTVAIVALPLALAFGVASGLGAQAGLATAVVAGTLAAIFGGSNLQVSGPTGAMTVVLLPVVARFGTQGVLLVGAMAGVLLIAFALARLGRYVRYLPMPVVEGFTAGIAVVIALQQVPAALGVSGAHGDRVWQVAADAVATFVRNPSPDAIALALGVAAVMLAGAHRRPGLPFSLLAVGAATVITRALGLDVALIGSLPSGLPSPSVGFVDLGTLGAMLPSALAIAALAALESLLSATVADGMSVGHRTDPDRELFLLVIVIAAAPLVGMIPLAALAGVLFATAIQMIESASLLALARSTRRDAAVLALTFTVTVAVDLVTAVAVGVGVAVVLALRAIAGNVRLDEVPLDTGDHSDEERALLAEHIVAYRLDGPLVFAAAHRFLIELTDVADVRVVILRMSRVSTIDATGARVLGDAIGQLERRGIVVLLSGVEPAHADVLAALGVVDDDQRLFSETPAAIEAARRIVHRRERPVAAVGGTAISGA